MKRLLALILLVLVVSALFWFLRPGGQLIVNNAQKSDAIVVLAGSEADNRYWRALELLRAGYGKHVVVDALVGEAYGRSMAELAREFVARTAGADAGRVSVCAIEGDSTKDEAPQVSQCLQRLQSPPQSVVVVTDDYHTRRALEILRHRAPQYRWTAAAAENRFLFGQPWWKHREWAKTYLTETEKLLWWELFDRWRS